MTKSYMSEHNAIRGFRRNFAHLAHLSNEMVRSDFINNDAGVYSVSLDAVADYEADAFGTLKATTIFGVPPLRRSTQRKGAVARVRTFFRALPSNTPRKDAVAAAVAAGFAYCTARTQYQIVKAA